MRTRIGKWPVPVSLRLRFQRVAVPWGGALLLALGLLAQPAAAQEGPADREPAWIPSFNVDFETYDYTTTTSITNLITPPTLEGTVSDHSPQLVIGLQGDLMGPPLERLPGRPRLFAQGGIDFNTFSGSTIGETGLLQGDPQRAISQFRIIRRQDRLQGCLNQNPPTCITADASEFEGQGAQVTGQMATPAWNAALGLAFDVPLRRSLLLQLRPSIIYNYQEVDMGARIQTVVEEPPGPTYETQEVFTVREGTASGSASDHSLGLGLELGLALFRSARPIRVSLYLDTRFLWLLSDPVTTFQDPSGTQTSFPDPPPAPPPIVTTPSGPVGSYQVERDTFEIRGGAGIRFSWVGYGPR
jgi:hypothetical protein